MSDGFIRADTGELEALAHRFQQTSQTFTTKADALNTRVTQAVSRFNQTLKTLQTRTNQLTSDMEVEVSSLGSQAGSVTWTGNNRAAFDNDLTTFSTAVRSGAQQLNQQIAQVKSLVASNFVPVLEDFGQSTKANAASGSEAAELMKKLTQQTNTALDQATNVGWNNA